MPCNHLRAGWMPGPSSVWNPFSQWGWGATRESIVVLDQIGNALPQSFSTRSPGGRDTPLTLPLSPPVAGPPWCQSKVVAFIGIAGPVGIGWMKCPQREWLCLGKGNQRTPMGDKVNW